MNCNRAPLRQPVSGEKPGLRKVETNNEGATSALHALPNEVLYLIIEHLLASDILSLMAASKAIRFRMTPEMRQAAAIPARLWRVRSLVDFRECLDIVDPSGRGAAAKPIMAATVVRPTTRKAVHPALKKDFFAKLTWRILALPKHEQADAAAELLKIARKHSDVPPSDAVTPKDMLRFLELKEQSVVEAAAGQCGRCDNARHIGDMAVALGVSSPSGVMNLTRYAARSAISRGVDLPSVVKAFEISAGK